MSDLISRSALLKIFNHDLKCFETNGKTEAEMYISVADMRKMINEQPTAYDVEKVVAELEKRRNKHNCVDCKHYRDGKGECREDCTDAIIDDLFDIVRKGGMYE